MRSLFVALLLVLTMLLTLFGCERQTHDWQYHGPGSLVPGNGGGGGDPFGGAGGAPSCDGDCVSVPRWHGPSLFAFATSPDLPACPDLAPNPGIELFDGLSAAPLDCPTCQCVPSATACAVPTDWHASAAKCADAASAEQTPFPAPPGWAGACTPENAVPGGLMCGGVACVQSVTVKAAEIGAPPCAAKTIGAAGSPPVTWATRARECLPDDPAACPESPPACRPPAGFALCIHRGGDVDCETPYPEKHLLYRSHHDARACSPCDCGPPAGNACIVFVTAYTNQSCGAVAGAINVHSAEGEGCFDVPAGFPLSAKTAEVIAALPGSCEASGGEPTGTVTPAYPVTVCCREETVPR